MGSAAVVPVEISSDEEDGEMMPAAAGKRKSPEGALDRAEKMLSEEDFAAIGEGLEDPTAVQELLDSLMAATGIVIGEERSAAVDKNTVPAARGDDDDCVILDGDPDKPVAIAKEEGPRRDAAEDELQIVAEKGEIACRDFPHPRHLCATLPFSTSSHASHCSMCHCYVCDAPAPCALWGKGTRHTDHCHATDKDANWKKLRQSSKNKSQQMPKRRNIQNFHQSSATGLSSQFPAFVNNSAVRFPVSSGLGQNQQVDPSIIAPWNLVQGTSQLRAPSPIPRATIMSCCGSKSAPVAPPVYTPSDVNRLRPSVPGYAPMQPAQTNAFQTAQVPPGGMQPAQPRTFQTAQVPPGGRVSAATVQIYHPQLCSGAPIGSQGLQYRPSSHPQLASNIVVSTQVPLSQTTSVATQGTQYQKVPLADTRSKEKEALASLARQLGLSDYNTNQPLGHQSVSTTQPLHPSQLLAQAKVRKICIATTSQMRPPSGHNLSNHASGGTVLSSGSVQIQQPLCQLNSQSSLTPGETTPSTFLGGK